MISNIPLIKLGELEFSLIQGGMGVGISQSKLASAVANEGGAGIIASVGLGVLNGYFEEEKKKNINRLRNVSDDERKKIFAELYSVANQNALRDEIRKSRKSTNGVIGVNIMHVLSDYSYLVKTAVNENVDLIISGAGIPRDLPSYLNGNSHTKIIPIVSSGKVAEMMCKSWKRLGHLPDAIIVEGPKAGGHLGYSKKELDDPEYISQGLERIVPEVILTAREYGNIPVIAAGGIFYGGDIRKFNEIGAAGVQMATRFVPTLECDADNRFKQAYLNCKKEDLVIINSPVGMPGRAIINPFLEAAFDGKKTPIHCPYHCLKTCKPDESPYCIARALIESQQGKFDNGYVFAGLNAWRTTEATGGKIVLVKDVFETLNREYSENKISD